MPIIVDPDAAYPPPVLSAESPDGILRATADDEYAGVMLRADYSGETIKPHWVKFVRIGLSPDRYRTIDVPVRGGNLARAVGGIARAYDYEVPLDTAGAWYAIPYYGLFTPVAGERSLGVGLSTSPSVVGQFDGWLKSIDNPAASQRIRLRLPEATVGMDGGFAPQALRGSPVPMGQTDVMQRSQFALVLRTETLAESVALRGDDAANPTGLITPGRVLLLQIDPNAGLPYSYVIPVAYAEDPHVGAWAQSRTVQITFQPAMRPPTAGAYLQVPGHSFADSLRLAPTFALRLALWPTFADVLDGAQPDPETIPDETGGGDDEGGGL